MSSPNAKPFTSPEDFNGNHVVSVEQFNRGSVEFLCSVAEDMRKIVETKSGCDLLKHKILANIFYEPSTRTSSSFAAAMQRLGGSVLQINESTSSAVKGETLSDSIKALQCYADVLVLRHPQQGSAAIASNVTPSKPLLNAGDGVGEHPTQALLDIYTILAEQQLQKQQQLQEGSASSDRVQGGLLLGAGGETGASSSSSSSTSTVTVTMVGDLKHGRTVHSLARILCLFANVTLQFVSPAILSMPEKVTDVLTREGRTFTTHTSLTPEVLAKTDVLYVTRVQKERFASIEEYEALKHYFIITPAILTQCKPHMAVLHPLPRVGEITEEVDSDPRAAYFRQMQNGLYIRMALLALLMGVTAAQVKSVLL